MRTPVAAIVASVAFFGLVAAGGADVNGPTLTALHAFVGDPLLGLDKPEGTLFGIQPDQQTAMASTTKIWTLDLTADALAQGKVHLDDKVTVSAFEASFGAGNSLMTDVNGKSLEAGEVVRLRDLVRGMMYHSGNDAAYVIARHVAQATLGPAATWQSFVIMMNAHAAALGQTDTHFENPAGVDGVTHHTTARELAEELQHGLADPYFAQVVGFKGTYTATTQGPNGPKTYSFGWGGSYPGWEGSKGGNTPNCNGPNGGCSVVAATRIGRRVVAAAMQAVGPDFKMMLDYGFARIFHPDLRGATPALGAASRHDVDCLANGRAVTAVLPPSGPVSLALWMPDVDGSSITKLTETTLPGSGITGRVPSADVAVTHLSSSEFVVATRNGSSVELSRWTINRAGALWLLASGISAGPATTMGLQPVDSNTFLTAMTDPSGVLVVKSWRLQGSGLVNLDTYKNASEKFTEVAIAGPLSSDAPNGHRAVTAAAGPWAGSLVHDVWGVDQATGKINLLGELSSPFNRTHVTISPLLVKTTLARELIPPVYYATAFRNTSSGPGDLEIGFYRVDPTGKPAKVGNTYSTVPVDEVRLAPLGTGGLMSAVRDPEGQVKLTAWEARRTSNDSIEANTVSEHEAPGAGSLDLCRVPSAHAEADYVTATKDLDGQLRLRTYRSGDRPY